MNSCGSKNTWTFQWLLTETFIDILITTYVVIIIDKVSFLFFMDFFFCECSIRLTDKLHATKFTTGDEKQSFRIFYKYCYIVVHILYCIKRDCVTRLLAPVFLLILKHQCAAVPLTSRSQRTYSIFCDMFYAVYCPILNPFNNREKVDICMWRKDDRKICQMKVEKMPPKVAGKEIHQSVNNSVECMVQSN